MTHLPTTSDSGRANFEQSANTWGGDAVVEQFAERVIASWGDGTGHADLAASELGSLFGDLIDTGINDHGHQCGVMPHREDATRLRQSSADSPIRPRDTQVRSESC